VNSNQSLNQPTYEKEVVSSGFDTSKSLLGLENFVDYSISNIRGDDGLKESPNFIKTRMQIAKFMMRAGKSSDAEFFDSYTDLWHQLKSMENTKLIYGMEISNLQDKVNKAFTDRILGQLNTQVEGLVKIKNKRLAELTKKYPELKNFTQDSNITNLLFLDIYFAILKLEKISDDCIAKGYASPFDNISLQILKQINKLRTKGSTILKSNPVSLANTLTFLKGEPGIQHFQTEGYADLVAGFMDGQLKSGKNFDEHIDYDCKGATIFSYILLYNHLPDIIDPYSYMLSHREDYPNLAKNITDQKTEIVVKIQLNEKVFKKENVSATIADFERELELLKTEEDFVNYHLTSNLRFKEDMRIMAQNEKSEFINMDSVFREDENYDESQIANKILAKYVKVKSLNASLESKQAQSYLNKSPGEVFQVRNSDYFHGKPVDILPEILKNGLIAPSFRRLNAFESNLGGSAPWRKNYIDLSHFEEKDNTKTVGQLFSHRVVYDYAQALGDILMVYNSSGDEKEIKSRNNRSIVWDNHAITPVGISSTSIRAIILGKDDLEIEAMTKKSISEYGAYIPVYNREGKLIFSYDEFQQKNIDNSNA
jgi:hypothetical protein